MDVKVLPSQGWAEGVASAWAAVLSHRPTTRMCLPTGQTPIPVYAAVTARSLSWGKASVLLLDEFGGLPPGEPGSCQATLRRSLVDRVDLPPSSFRSIDTAATDLAAECRDIDTWLDAGLDLAVLGLGGNGHLGMNEPHSSTSARTRRVQLAPSTVESATRYFAQPFRPSWGVTVGLRDLFAAQTVWVLATGKHKAQTVRSCLVEGPDPSLPASLLQDHPGCTWWLDEPAASGL